MGSVGAVYWRKYLLEEIAVRKWMNNLTIFWHFIADIVSKWWGMEDWSKYKVMLTQLSFETKSLHELNGIEYSEKILMSPPAIFFRKILNAYWLVKSLNDLTSFLLAVEVTEFGWPFPAWALSAHSATIVNSEVIWSHLKSVCRFMNSPRDWQKTFYSILTFIVMGVKIIAGIDTISSSDIQLLAHH